MSYAHPSAVIHTNAILEDGVYIGPFCLIGASPEIKGYTGAQWGVVIRKDAKLQGMITIDAGSVRPTEIGAAYIMKHCHVGHDAIVDDNVTMSPFASVGGHSRIWPYAVMGMHSVIHQHHELAPGAMLAMGCVLPKSVQTEPFTIYVGSGQRLRENTKLLKELPQAEVERLYALWENRNK